MCFQDALYQLDIDFTSERCVAFADESMEVVAYYAILASSELAKERGTYESYKGSKWDRGIFPLDSLSLLEAERGETVEVARSATLDWAPVREAVKKYGIRNSNTMAIAPTATISNIAGCCPAIEPVYKNIYVESNISGDFTVVNPFLVEDLKKLNLWNDAMLNELKFRDGSIAKIAGIPETVKAKYKETFEIDMRWLIRAAAYRGKWIDQSQSLNIFFRGASGRELSEVYFYAWNLGLKTTYYLRTLAATQVEKSTVSTAQFGSTHTREKEESHHDMSIGMAMNPATSEVPVSSVSLLPAQSALAASASVVSPISHTLQSAREATQSITTHEKAPEVAVVGRQVYTLHRSSSEEICESCQ